MDLLHSLDLRIVEKVHWNVRQSVTEFVMFSCVPRLAK